MWDVLRFRFGLSIGYTYPARLSTPFFNFFEKIFSHCARYIVRAYYIHYIAIVREKFNVNHDDM